MFRDLFHHWHRTFFRMNDWFTLGFGHGINIPIFIHSWELILWIDLIVKHFLMPCMTIHLSDVYTGRKDVVIFIIYHFFNGHFDALRAVLFIIKHPHSLHLFRECSKLGHAWHISYLRCCSSCSTNIFCPAKTSSPTSFSKLTKFLPCSASPGISSFCDMKPPRYNILHSLCH